MAPGEHLLLGFDLIKDPARLEAAYNDSQGVTAAFNRNVLQVLNRFSRADFDPGAFGHRAIYNQAEHRIEMWLDAGTRQIVHLQRLGLTLAFASGNGIRTEISVKYDRTHAETLLHAARLEPVAWFSDPDALFALALARRPRPGG
jgi:L-histidine N-alpha-methyltransferase